MATATIDSEGRVNGVAVTRSRHRVHICTYSIIFGGGGSGATATASTMNVVEFNDTDIGEVLRISNNDPYDVGHADEVAFRVEFSSTSESDYGQVTLVDRSSTKPVFVLYRKPFVDYSSTSEDFLYIFLEYATYGAYGDFLAADGQTDKAQVAYQQAESLLLVELDKLGASTRATKLYTIHYIRNNIFKHLFNHGKRIQRFRT